MSKIPVIVVVGPTASGKTSLAVEIAKRTNGEIVSADSMQIYRTMDIATAKPTKAEMCSIKHHLIDFVEPDEKYSVAKYKKAAEAALHSICEAHKTPILAGGTGLYIDTVIDNIELSDEPDNTLMRAQLKQRLLSEGAEALFNELEKADPETAASLHINNMSRVIRALEVYYLTGEKMSDRIKRSRLNPSEWEPLFIGLDFRNRDKLYERINRRVDEMFENGLEAEARAYFERYSACTASQAIGYKEIKGYLEGEKTLEQAKEDLKQATRNYAKRQLTWFRKNERINRIYVDELSEGQSAASQAMQLINSSTMF